MRTIEIEEGELGLGLGLGLRMWWRMDRGYDYEFGCGRGCDEIIDYPEYENDTEYNTDDLYCGQIIGHLYIIYIIFF